MNRPHAALEQLRRGSHRKVTNPLTSHKHWERVSRLISDDQAPRAQIIRRGSSHLDPQRLDR